MAEIVDSLCPLGTAEYRCFVPFRAKSAPIRAI
jgi:hypothetical protein